MRAGINFIYSRKFKKEEPDMVDINGDFSLKLRALQAQKGQKSQNGIRPANIDPRMSMNGSIFAPFAGGGATG